MPPAALFLAILLAVLLATAGRPADLVRFDFESGDLQGWQVMEGRFDRLICDRDLCRNTPGMRLNKQGRYFLSTIELADGNYNDGMTGVLESPVFTLTGPRITCLVGGGAHADTYLALCTTDGLEQRRATGAFSEIFAQVAWDVPELVGRQVYLTIVDRHTGGWGHVTFDDFTAQGQIDDAATARLRGSYAARARARQAHEQALVAAGKAAAAKHAEQLRSDRYLFDRGKQDVYRGDRLAAINLPVGGIGAGCILLDGTARPAGWQIWGHHRAVPLPDSFLAIRARAGGEPVVRALQTVPAGPFPPMRALEFRGEYPFAWYDFHDPALPVRVSLEAWNPLIPLATRDSALPCAIFTVTVENTGRRPAEVSLLAGQQNAVGLAGETPDGRRCAAYGGNRNQVAADAGVTLLRMTAGHPGSMALALTGAAAQGTASWANPQALLAGFTATGTVRPRVQAGPSPNGQTLNGALTVPFRLAPGERRAVTVILAWHFPGVKHGTEHWGGTGNQYENWWPDAAAVAREVAARLPELAAGTRLYHDTLYQSNLPRWLIDRLSSQVAILRSQTCFWTKDGYFGGFEGCGCTDGCCLGNCSHVWHYAQAHARLFPEIGRLMRQQELGYQKADGAVPHRQSPEFGPATDGQCGAILGAYREHLVSADRRWLDGQWPLVRKAMDYTIATWDADGDGVLAGAQWNTLDDALGGNSSWIGSLYLAALAASERMALLEGDADTAARYGRLRAAGMRAQDQALWNGEYYVQVTAEQPRKDYGAGCHIDQVLGQWWAAQLDLGDVYPADRVRAAMQALLKHNFHPDFWGFNQAPRKFVDDPDAGLQMITWPRGGRPEPAHQIYYADEVMTGFEYAAAATMVQAGLLREGFTVARAVHDRYDGRLRRGLTPGDTASWGYSGNPFGDDECGKFYARAMSVWSILLACQGFSYDGPAGSIGFRPQWRPDDHASFFTAAEGWGLFTQRRRGNALAAKLDLRYGRLRLERITLAAPGATKAAVTVAGRPVTVTLQPAEGAVTVALPAAVLVEAGQAIELTLSK